MAQPTMVFVGIKGTVLALDRGTGQELWRTDLRGADFVSLTSDGGEIYAATRGELFCLDPATGQIRWHNPLRGLGRGLVTVAPASTPGAAVAEEKRRRDKAAAAAAIG